MIFFFAAFVVVAFLIWRGRVGQVIKGQWRVPAGIASVGLFAAAGFEALRGGLIPGGVLLILGLVLLGTARWPRASRAAAAPSGSGMGAAEARSILGVGPDASEAEIRAAHSRLIRIAHPDTGGTTGLAAQLNAARDRLLKR